MDARDLIERVAGWSRADRRVSALGLLGSHARGDARPDSDIDFCILAPDPAALLGRSDWYSSFGDARLAGPVEDYALVQSLRIFYGRVEAEFGIAPESWATPPLDAGTAAVLNEGFKILHDPDGRLAAAAADAALRAR